MRIRNTNLQPSTRFWNGPKDVPTDGKAIPRMKDEILVLGLHGSLSVVLPSHPWGQFLSVLNDE